MSFPCVCFKCKKCLSLESLYDPQCLAVEEANCQDRSCSDCDFNCSRYSC